MRKDTYQAKEGKQKGKVMVSKCQEVDFYI